MSEREKVSKKWRERESKSKDRSIKGSLRNKNERCNLMKKDGDKKKGERPTHKSNKRGKQSI